MNYVWKEWKEQSRSKGLWLSLSMIVLLSFFLLLQSSSFPSEQGFQVFLMSLYDMTVFFTPLLSLFVASFAVMQEKEQKTLFILLTKKESYRTFFLKKSLAVQCVILLLFVGWYFVFALFMKFFLAFDSAAFLVFLAASLSLLVIFIQLGLLLGSICSTRMQLIGANIFVWFFFLFLADIIFLYSLPSISKENVTLFSVFFFFDPLHTLRFYLETSLYLFPLDHLSRLMEDMIWLAPAKFLLLDLLIWVLLSFEIAVILHSKGDKT
ncbi:ABC transporter permease [Aneurinibacillus migulanus]|uniref:ABC-2 type transport system permease protein n=1 Tax=Aneurinibacillus migulanus TaxID=47500 RepID=A0A0D1XPB9_ANEMI|nr:ABC transporter permease subunit [Aneurinibacillus migulanus]KIV54048.1 copper ABC transporter permease [Aneurinibacillus migulanus]KON97709.1 copper ABC transporter permease [Aneurinibacillus migulanus]MED0894478.1 ABC transporter permease subunit [Aneurinibacillus migulanus]MED1617088.1 ABC transporter permease subunit [Aneurinibacillus migulanus]SDJ34089.1 ABC-2 type transport system permease protein [Aneurinibacillus migulanus]